MRKKYSIMASGLMLLLLLSCGGAKNKTNDASSVKPAVSVPVFNADTAYMYVQKQVDFGARVPNTSAHEKCGDYLIKQLERLGAKVTVQSASLVAYNGTLLRSRNIIGSYNPDNKVRIALFSHWDCRPWADNDPDKANHRKPVMGANDAASGVGVLLEIARNIHKKQPSLGIDIIFLDAEDYGTHQDEKTENSDEASWCLGAQYWAHNPHVQNYNARFGILLDMVGGKSAAFYREYYSEQYARDICDKVWTAAKTLGYGKFFIDESKGGITDDHLFINKIAGIKTVDIVPQDPAGNFEFDPTWHTTKDTMDNIDPNVLKAVGQTVLNVIYNEQ